MEDEDAPGIVYFAGSYYFSPDEVIDQFGEDNEDLMYKYFTNPWTVENLRIEQHDKKRVLQIVKSKILGLSEKERFGHKIKIKDTGLLINARPLSIIEELKLLERSIEVPKRLPPTEEETATEQVLEKIEALSAERLYEIMYQTSWWLLHPRDIPKDIRSAFLSILEANKRSGLDILLSLKDTKGKSPKAALRTFMDSDVANPVIQQGTLRAAAKRTKASIGKGSRQLAVQLQDRIKQVFDIFGALGFLSPGRKQTLQQTNPDTLQSVMEGLPKEIGKKLWRSMDPIYRFYETQYGDAYRLIRGFMVNKFGEAVGPKKGGPSSPRAPVSFPIDAILTLLERSQQIRDKLEAKTMESEGLIELMNIPPNMIVDFQKVQTSFIEYVSSQYQNSAIKTPGSPSSNLYDLLAGTDTHILQFMRPTLSKEPTLSDFRAGTRSMSDTQRKPFVDTATQFFDKKQKHVYIVVQPRIDTKDRKKIGELHPYLYDLPETNKAALDAFNTIAATNTFNSLGIRVDQPDFVRSITDRSAALMAVLYFRLHLEKIDPTLKRDTKPLKPVLKKREPVVVGNASTGQGTTGTATGTATATATTGSQP